MNNSQKSADQKSNENQHSDFIEGFDPDAHEKLMEENLTKSGKSLEGENGIWSKVYIHFPKDGTYLNYSDNGYGVRSKNVKRIWEVQVHSKGQIIRVPIDSEKHQGQYLGYTSSDCLWLKSYERDAPYWELTQNKIDKKTYLCAIAIFASGLYPCCKDASSDYVYATVSDKYSKLECEFLSA